MARIKYLWIVLWCGLVSLPVLGFDTTLSSCEIDITEQTHTCDNFTNLDIDFGKDNALLTIDLAPRYEYQRVRFAIHYGSTPDGWTVNIGDSSTNGGYGGDGSTQSNDAELQIVGTAFTIYGNDYTPTAYTPDSLRQLLHDPLFMAENHDVTLEIGDGYVHWGNGGGQQGTLELPYLFALNNQADQEGQSNYTIYAGFNRVVSGAHRSGSGVTQVTVTFLRSDDTEEGVAVDTCNGFSSQLVVGQFARMSANLISDIYTGPTHASKRIERLAGGTPLEIIAGPICQGSDRWWFIHSETISGWTVENPAHQLESMPSR